MSIRRNSWLHCPVINPNIRQTLQQARQELEQTSPTARLDAEVLLMHTLQCNSAHLLAWPERKLSDRQLSTFRDLLQQRKQGLPVAYLTGEKEFWSLNLSVNRSTLIPRPETETLVEFILTTFGEKKDINILDMGTGTGAIAIAVASENPGWNILASDISAQILELARHNSERHRTKNIRFIKSHWFEDIHQHDFDIIVSNPPYIADNDPHLQQGDVRFEPGKALTAGIEGMDDIEHICSHAPSHLRKGGWLVLEHGYDQQQAVADCFAENGFTDIRQLEDLSGQPRMTAGKNT